METRITKLLGIKYPILQGGMAWIAESTLAAAVSNAGGVGIIAGGSAPIDYLRDQIRRAKSLTDKPFGVNIMLMSPNAEVHTYRSSVYHKVKISLYVCQKAVAYLCVLVGLFYLFA